MIEILILIAILLELFCILKLKHEGEITSGALAKATLKIKELEDRQSELSERAEKMQAAYDEATEMIEATKEYTREATNSEKMWQDGFSAIVNYDAVSALKDGGNKE